MRARTASTTYARSRSSGARRRGVEEAYHARDRLVDLPDDRVAGPFPHHPLDLGLDVLGVEEECRCVGADALVLVERDLEPLRAAWIPALAHELGLVRIEPLRRLGDPLVDVPIERFRLRDLERAFVHFPG
jgi:hypothetical protein